VRERPRDDAFLVGLLLVAFHRVGLACAGLAVCEDRPVVALEHALYDGQGRLFEDALLQAAWFEGQVEAEDSLLFSHLFGVID
jgi:hypothetical protein